MNTITVASDALALVVSPADGGRVVSMPDATHGEWLLAAEPRSPAAPFTADRPGGWDECAPTIDACTWSGLLLPDHGDVWRRPWVVTSHRDDCVVLAVHSPLGFDLVRTITVRGHSVQVDYAATSVRKLPFLWAAHPLFLAPAGSHVSIGGVHRVIDMLRSRTAQAVSPDLLTIDTVPVGGCRKIYVDPVTRLSTAALVHADGARLTMRWSGTVRYLGLWFDNQCYSAQPAIALEPSTGFADSAVDAAGSGRISYLRPGQSLHWSLTLEITPPSLH